MDIGIFCNFSYSIGGSEYVIHHISKRLISFYNHRVTVYSFNLNAPKTLDKVKYRRCEREKLFLRQVNQYNYIMVYSDSFWEFRNLLTNISNIKPNILLVLVGAYYLSNHNDSFNKFKDNFDKFNIIVHSGGYHDAMFCKKNNLNFNIIPNGVELNEFNNDSNNDFKNKYNIKEKNIILNVGNLFYGKGFEILPKVCGKLRRQIDDFVIIQISNTIKYPYDQIFFERTKKQSEGLNIRFLRDLPREDVVVAFKCSDIFLFTSKK